MRFLFAFNHQFVGVQMDKYDEAIEFLKGFEPGSYFDECAELMEELLAQLEAKPKRWRPSSGHVARLKQMDAGARHCAKASGLVLLLFVRYRAAFLSIRRGF